MAENRYQIEQRLKAAGKWVEFQKRRAALKNELRDGQAAWHMACAEFEHVYPEPDDATSSNPGPQAKVAGRVKASVFKGKQANTRKNVMWVAESIALDKPDPKDAPSSQAWGMLMWVRRSPQNESEFWRQIYPKLLPSRTQVDNEDAKIDDGGAVLSMIEDVRTAAREAAAETG